MYNNTKSHILKGLLTFHAAAYMETVAILEISWNYDILFFWVTDHGTFKIQIHNN